MANNGLRIERVAEVSPDVSAGVGELMPDLSQRLSPDSIAEDILRDIVSSSDRDLFIARLNGRIVGSAVMNLIVSTTGRKAWLDDFVVSADDSVRGKGVGFALWKEIVRWADEHDAPVEFTSSLDRHSAHDFYMRQGAVVRPTTVFRYESEFPA